MVGWWPGSDLGAVVPSLYHSAARLDLAVSYFLIVGELNPGTETIQAGIWPRPTHLTRIGCSLSLVDHTAVALLPDFASVHSVRPAKGSPPRTPSNKAPHRTNWGGTLGERPSLDIKTRESSFAAIASVAPLIFLAHLLLPVEYAKPS
jgi:hypothetical protein